MFVGKERVYYQKLIDARVIGLLASSREIKFGHVLAYELAAYPPPMFNPCGEMKITKSKSTTKLKLQVVISEGNCSVPETFIYDVSALLWVLTWATDERQVYVDALLFFDHHALQKSNVTLVFDRYFPNSRKNFTKLQRWFKSGVQADIGYACSSQISHSHQYQEQDSTECHARRRPAQLRLLHECNTEAYSDDCWCQRRASGDSWWCTD